MGDVVSGVVSAWIIATASVALLAVIGLIGQGVCAIVDMARGSKRDYTGKEKR